MAKLKRDEKGRRIKRGICVDCKHVERLNHRGVCEACLETRATEHLRAYHKRVHDLDGIIGIPERIEKLRAEGFSYRLQADQLGSKVTPADLSRLAKGKEPKNPDKRAALHLPLYAPAPVCSEHNGVGCLVCGGAAKPKRPKDTRRRHRINVDPDTKAAVRRAADAQGITEAEWLRQGVIYLLDIGD